MSSCQVLCIILLNYIMNRNLLSCVSLVLAAPYCVFYVKRHQIYSRFVSSGKYFGQKPLFLPHPSKFWKPYFFLVFYFRKISSHHHCHHFHLNIKHFWRGIGWSFWGKPFDFCHVNFLLGQSSGKNREAAYFSCPPAGALLAKLFTRICLMWQDFCYYSDLISHR